ncbi:hypothetical protein GF339_18910 [candidate division KSB3 bacterium]|uniref:Rubrerythrin diiron-binding domain-containing protein n=1 Tax=candidate division KSB3 bacterium TaxID=2044937 RepID=A0A9D5JZH7_9BACT|nr:hypothetical protein [candidate division KSB3 bacterium]MBD3326662.1 hypothetical protein [candidate division KSB3 bacterium]
MRPAGKPVTGETACLGGNPEERIMANIFYINEIVNFAIEREQESYALYKDLADKVQDPEPKQVFQTLMAEEQKHKELYTELLSKVEHKRTPSAQGYDEYDDYMRTLIDSRRTVKQPNVGLENIPEVLDFAIEREKDAVLFYTGLENYVSANDQPTIKDIIREEGSHIVKLTRLKGNFT